MQIFEVEMENLDKFMHKFKIDQINLLNLLSELSKNEDI